MNPNKCSYSEAVSLPACDIKLTTKDDLEMFKAYLKQDEDTWLK